MKKDNAIPASAVSPLEKQAIWKFWLLSFSVYALVEMGFWVIHYYTIRESCDTCSQPVWYYIFQWFLSLVFTALVWYCLNLIYGKSRWLIVTGNVVLFAAHFLSWVMVKYNLAHSGPGWLMGISPSRRDLSAFIYDSWIDIGKYVFKVSAFYVLKFYLEFRRTARQRTSLALLNKDLQLKLLRQQLSPHFYFNTLNNLYGLARSNSPKLSDALFQLSNIMQYVIIECNKPKVLLSQELEFLKSYISLEKLRYEQNTIIEMEVEGHPNGQSILPLLLIQFVENAFKHGMKEKSEINWMKVKMVIDRDALFFSVNNSYYEPGFSNGIGISSVQHSLDLQYEGKYDLLMRREDGAFLVTLKLNLS